MGGLGNQMFQYAAARALSERNGVPLFLDDHNGFVRDFIYKRTYELDAFPVRARIADRRQKFIYWAEKTREKLFSAQKHPIEKHLSWTVVKETAMHFIPEVADCRITGNTWMHGYWQSEKYFSGIKDIIAQELMPAIPTDEKFREYGRKMRSCNSVSLGVRLFEEVPGASKEGVGGLTIMSFFNDAAKRISAEVADLEFFVFCTTNSPELDKLELPGNVHLITHDNGFHGTMARLWLMTQCKHHIIANSSFYWWAAWLSEMTNENCRIIASPIFSNSDTIPPRWL